MNEKNLHQGIKQIHQIISYRNIASAFDISFFKFLWKVYTCILKK